MDMTFFIIILSLSIINSQKYIILPFEEYSYNSNNIYPTVLDFFKSQFINNIYTLLKIGTPSQTLLTFIKTEEIVLMIKDDATFYNKTNYTYNPKNSSSFINITALSKEYFDFRYSIINETINFCKDENCKNVVQFPNFNLNLIPLESYDNKTKPLTGTLGFLFSDYYDSYDSMIAIIQLIKEEFINSYKISIIFKNEHCGYIIFGEDLHVYDSNNFKENQKLWSYMKYRISDSYINYRLEMNKIYFNNGNEIISFVNKNLEVKFNFDYGIILAPKDYYYQIKKVFFDKYEKICNESDIFVEVETLIVYSCQANNFNITEFPTLYFYNIYMNYTFELNYKDLFYKNGDEYIFLVAFNKVYESIWSMGKPFLKKYQLTFDPYSKIIYYYDTIIKKENKENGAEKIILIVVVIIICGLVLFIAGYISGKKLNEMRKKKANELGDDFDYTIKDNDNIGVES